MEDALRNGAGFGVQFRKMLDDTMGVKITSLDQHQAPKYSHDRCERSVQMRIYTMSKQHFTVAFGSFAICLAVFLLIGITGPPISATIEAKLSELSNKTTTDVTLEPMQFVTPGVSPYCQQLWVMIRVISKDTNNDAIFRTKFHIETTITGLDKQMKEVGGTKQATGNREHTLSCKGQICDTIVVAHLGSLDFTHYLMNVKLNDLKQFGTKFGIQDVELHFKSYNPVFTKLEILTRFFLVIVTFIIAVLYYQTMKPYSTVFWSLEQKWVAILLPLLLFYDNPLFPMVFMMSGWFPVIAEGVFQATFLCSLLLFWLCVYHGIRQSTRSFFTFYVPKLFVVGLLWTCAVLLTAWDRINELRDTAWYSDQLEQSVFALTKAVFFISGIFYLLLLTFWLIRAYGELRNMPYFDIRLKFITLTSMLVVIVTVLLTASNYGVAPSLEDHFIADLSTKYSSSVDFMLFYGLLNIYVYSLAYVYAPAGDVPNEALSGTMSETLMNDSEDEMIYGASDFFSSSAKAARSQGGVADSSSDSGNEVDLFVS